MCNIYFIKSLQIEYIYKVIFKFCTELQMLSKKYFENFEVIFFFDGTLWPHTTVFQCRYVLKLKLIARFCCTRRNNRFDSVSNHVWTSSITNKRRMKPPNKFFCMLIKLIGCVSPTARIDHENLLQFQSTFPRHNIHSTRLEFRNWPSTSNHFVTLLITLNCTP